MTPMTPAQRLAGILLGRPVRDHIIEQQAAGVSYRKIADDLRQRTNGQVSVSAETIRSWEKRGD